MATKDLYATELEWTQKALDRVETILNSENIDWIKMYAILKTRLEGLALAVSINEDLPLVGSYADLEKN